jgi:hypothetical protein
MSKMAREKGKRGEREAAKLIADTFRVEASRGCQFAGGEDSPDIRTAIEKVHFEVKRTEALRLWDALDQAIKDANGNVPVVLHRANNRPWVAIVHVDDLPRLAVQLYLTLAANPTYGANDDESVSDTDDENAPSWRECQIRRDGIAKSDGRLG